MLTDNQLVIDRIENNVAHLETEHESLALPATWLPADARPGDIITATRTGNGIITLEVDPQATEERRNQMTSLRSTLKRGPGGDIDL